MGITSFTLSGLGVDAAASGVKWNGTTTPGTGQGKYWDLGPGATESRLRGGNQQLLPNEEAIAIGERVLFQDRILRYAEAGSDSRERVPFTHDIALLLTRSGNRRRA